MKMMAVRGCLFILKRNDEPVQGKRPFEIIIDHFLIPRKIMVVIIGKVLLCFMAKLWEPIHVEHFWSLPHVWKIEQIEENKGADR